MAPGLAAVSAGPFLAACALLVGSGVQKLRRPEPGRAALLAAGARVPTVAVVALGGLEVGVGVAGAAVGRAGALLVAFLYLALAGFAARLLTRAPATPCACLGSSTATVSRPHVVIDIAAAAVAFGAGTGGSPLTAIAHGPLAATAFVALVGCCVELLSLSLDALPVLQRAVKEPHS
jgi:hypothetical protein